MNVAHEWCMNEYRRILSQRLDENGKGDGKFWGMIIVSSVSV